MPPYQAVPLTSDGNNVRLEKFMRDTEASVPPASAGVRTGAVNTGVPVDPALAQQTINPDIAGAVADGELDAEEIDALTQAHAAGDQEAGSLLQGLGLLVGGAAAVGGAVAGGKMLSDAVARSTPLAGGRPGARQAPIHPMDNQTPLVEPSAPRVDDSHPEFYAARQQRVDAQAAAQADQVGRQHQDFYRARQQKAGALMRGAAAALSHRAK